MLNVNYGSSNFPLADDNDCECAGMRGFVCAYGSATLTYKLQIGEKKHFAQNLH